ncbi:MAG: SusF/SusE family outer membrane protein [Prevotella sp.]|nr:SusF/SusE family outer membrane protein [Prevotella sp.]
MKNIVISALLLLCGISLFTACEDDNNSNPVIQSPTTFKLNTPSYATSSVDLASSDSLNFTWSQPDYGGWPAAAEYQLQVSLTNTFQKAYNDQAEDASENDGADYVTIDSYYRSTTGSITSTALATALQILGNWDEDSVLTNTPVYVRASCVVPGSTTASTSSTIYSNTVTINTVPYFVQLKDADPLIWYLIGADIGDGKWTNSADATGVSNYPMFAIPGETYDTKTGTGKIQYAGYFHAGNGFKIIETLGSWDYGICGGSTVGTTSYRSGGDDPGNITVSEDGYYLIVLDTKTHDCTITKMDTTPTVYSSMAIPGSENNWNQVSGDALSAFSTVSGVNHDWVGTVTYNADAGSKDGCKFAADGAWSANWGSADFPYGTGTNGGSNILFKAGTYKVFFNDILGSYSFVAQ